MCQGLLQSNVIEHALIAVGVGITLVLTVLVDAHLLPAGTSPFAGAAVLLLLLLLLRWRLRLWRRLLVLLLVRFRLCHLLELLLLLRLLRCRSRCFC